MQQVLEGLPTAMIMVLSLGAVVGARMLYLVYKYPRPRMPAVFLNGLLLRGNKHYHWNSGHVVMHIQAELDLNHFALKRSRLELKQQDLMTIVGTEGVAKHYRWRGESWWQDHSLKR